MHLVYENTKEEIIAIKRHRFIGHRICIMRWKLYMLQRDALNSVLEKNFSIWIRATLVLSFQISFTTIKYFHVSTIRQFI